MMMGTINNHYDLPEPSSGSAIELAQQQPDFEIQSLKKKNKNIDQKIDSVKKMLEKTEEKIADKKAAQEADINIQKYKV